MHYFVGFLIALAVGLTGVGGGSFTVPALVLLAGLTAGEAVGTAFLFAGVLRLIAAPFYLAGKHIHSRYLWLLLQGAVPGLLVGTWALQLLNRDAGNPIVILLLGIILAASSSVTFIRRIQNPAFAAKIFLGGSWSARNRSAVELFRNDARPSRGNGFAVRPGFGGDWRRLSLGFGLHQPSDTFSTSSGWRPRSGARLLVRSESSRK